MTQALLGYYEYDTLRLRYRANAAPASMGAYILYEYDQEPGKAYRDDVPDLTTFTVDWTEGLLEGDPIGGSRLGCKVVGGGIWIRSSATSLVKGSLYARLNVQRAGSAQEECLCCGYIYDAKPFLTIGEHADLEMSEAIATMDVTLQQANVAGGAIRIDIVPGAGSAMTPLYAGATNSGTNAVLTRVMTALASGAEIVRLQSVGSGAGTVAFLGLGAAGTNSTNTAQGGFGHPLVIAGTNTLQIGQTGTGAQNDTLRLIIAVRVKGALPTASFTNSSNSGDVTATAGALSFAFVS